MTDKHFGNLKTTDPLVCTDLADLVCEGCGQKHAQLGITSNCHPESGLLAMFNKPTGILYLGCIECDELVATFKIQPTKTQ